MVTEEQIEIILRAQDQASQTTTQVEEKLKKVGDTAQQANQKALTAEDLYNRKVEETKNKLDPLISKVNDVGNEGSSAFQQLSASEQESIIKFNMLDKETQDTLQAIRELGVESADMIPGADDAIKKLMSMDEKVKTFGGSFDYARAKLELMGTSTDTFKGKLAVIGNGIQTYVVNKWDAVKTKVSSSANFIKTAMGSALSHVRSSIQTVGDAFSGLGGIISSAIGAIGMASISDLTVGLAMNRERMTALTSATMGSAEAGKQFVDVMDNFTNNSLVSLDDLGQAMSTIKMSTGMSNAELQNFTTTVNDVGQRAILMGKSGEEAMALMQAAGRGLNGEFDMLKTNFGITKEQLQDLGWTGAANDVKGYQQALEKALESGGKMDGMMDTSVGHLETLKKNIRVAGRHVGEMFTPYIDQAVQALNSLSDTCPGLYESLVMVAGGISGFATIGPSITPVLTAFDQITGKGASILRFFGLLEAAEGQVTFATAANTLAIKLHTIGMTEEAAATEASAMANMGLVPSLWAVATGVWAVLAPLLPFIAAAALVAIAIYEIGKSFGWWDDLPSLFEAVWSGLNRLWSAFINHPDIQAFIKGLGQAWDDLCAIIGVVASAVAEFFNIQTDGEFDIVRALIEGIGAAWEIIREPIVAVLTVIADVIHTMRDLAEGNITFADAFMQIWTSLAENIGPILANIGILLVQFAFQVLSYALKIGYNFLTGVLSYVSQLPRKIILYLSNILLNIISYGARWVSNAKSKASAMVAGVVSYVSQLPRKVATHLQHVVGRIASAGSQWISTAKSKATAMVNGTVSIVSNLPGKIYNEFVQVGTKINQAVSSAVSAATNFGSAIKNAVLGALHIASPGIIQKKINTEFINTVSRIEDQIGAAKSAGASFGNAIVDGFGDVGVDANSIVGSSAFNVTGSQQFAVSTGEYIVSDENLTVDVNNNLKLDLNLSNVPEHISTNDLIEALTDKNVVKAIATNNDFQDFDSKMKRRIQGRVNRAKGV